MASFKPDGRPSIIPRIFTHDVAGLSAFVRDVFEAEGDTQTDAPTELRIGDCVIMISDGGGVRGPMPAALYVYVGDANAAYTRALALDATSVDAPAPTPWGDTRATVQDRWGNIWQMATHRPV